MPYEHTVVVRWSRGCSVPLLNGQLETPVKRAYKKQTQVHDGADDGLYDVSSRAVQEMCVQRLQIAYLTENIE